MKSGSVGSADSLANFLRVTQEARIRNRGLNGVAPQKVVSEPTMVKRNTVPAPTAAAYTKNASFEKVTEDAPKVKLGSMFDAYA